MLKFLPAFNMISQMSFKHKHSFRGKGNILFYRLLSRTLRVSEFAFDTYIICERFLLLSVIDSLFSLLTLSCEIKY